MIVYIRTQGARVVREGRLLQVKKEKDTLQTLFTYKLDQLVLFGSVEITHAALVSLMRNNVDVVFLSANGRYLGRLSSAEARNVYLRRRQFQLLEDPAFGLRVARAIVAGKLANLATLLYRIKRTRDAPLAGKNAVAIQELLPLVEKADNLDTVRGYEGRGSALYFAGFPAGFVGDWGFTRRVRRPPTDPVNSVLSLLYTFLMNRVYAAVRIAALDPYLGCLHAMDFGRYSLVLDLMEEFRPIVADTLTLSLFNLRILRKDDFYVEKPFTPPGAVGEETSGADVTADPIGWIADVDASPDIMDLPEQTSVNAEPGMVRSGKYPVKLRDEAMRRVIEAFEKKLTTLFFYPPAERHISYGEAIIYQAQHYRKVVEGEVGEYRPLLFR
ncbi:MAG TPA: CRISPR-associated endonuclease Cas1 [Syntrophales bacterium]|nr:CRISPR-associated endonuclease Cas1 [Syntrophales bacterium]HOM08330.1 CRISPR-associated endonuclease Cas1 [Syntrophales bacterium]HOO00957.1 CRISPR-associated endonuclease Cas1 [Syntrophales bacterium]HPC02081.1 CRISPR-associated endonuclease Cas1 [Syntrophales bacterium]HRS88026.1 CRISPR-associated endonuclease Cas1 [Syntrophales bacterium]